MLTNLSQFELEKIDRLVKHEGFDHFEMLKKIDPLLDKEVNVTKIVASDPLAIGGRPPGHHSGHHSRGFPQNF